MHNYIGSREVFKGPGVLMGHPIRELIAGIGQNLSMVTFHWNGNCVARLFIIQIVDILIL